MKPFFKQQKLSEVDENQIITWIHIKDMYSNHNLHKCLEYFTHNIAVVQWLKESSNGMFIIYLSLLYTNIQFATKQFGVIIHKYKCLCVEAKKVQYIYSTKNVEPLQMQTYNITSKKSCNFMLYLYHRFECFAWYIRTSPRDTGPRVRVYISGKARVPVVKVLCTTLPMQADSPPMRGENQDLLYRPLGKIRLWACRCKQEPPLYLCLSTKMGKSYEKCGKFL